MGASRTAKDCVYLDMQPEAGSPRQFRQSGARAFLDRFRSMQEPDTASRRSYTIVFITHQPGEARPRAIGQAEFQQ
jgi:hypothetical protein